LDVLLDDLKGCAPGRNGTIAWGPESIASKSVLNFRELGLSEASGRDALQAVHEVRKSDLRRILNEKMDVIGLTRRLNQNALEVSAHLLKGGSCGFPHSFREDSAAVLRHKDQMGRE